MARDHLVVGLDIGTTKICTVVAEVDPQKHFNILGIGLSPSTGMKKGVVVDVEETVASIRQSVERAKSVTGTDFRSVCAGITGCHIASTNSSGVISISSPSHRITEEDVARALDVAENLVVPPDRQIIHSVPRNYLVDGQGGIRHPVGMFGFTLEVQTHVITGSITFIQNVVTCIQQVGLNVDSLVLEPIAAGEVVVNSTEKQLGVALIDIGGGTTDVAVFVDGSIVYSSVIPVGGNHVTNDLSVCLRTSFDDAERLKLKAAYTGKVDETESEMISVVSPSTREETEIPRSLLREIVEPRMTELFTLVKEEIRKSGCHRRLASGAVLTGGGALLTGTLDLASTVLDLPVHIGKPTGVVGIGESLNSPIYSTAVGLVHYGAQHMFREKAAGDRWHWFDKLREWLRLLWER